MRMTGVLYRLLPNRGFGFVRSDDDRISRFMHAKDVEPREDFDLLHEGQRVEFTPEETRTGHRATKVKKC